MLKKMVFLGTGGTIAGTAAEASDNVGYTAAQLGVGQLLQAIPRLQQALGPHAFLAEQVVQVDSKDMGWAQWRVLVERIHHHLAQPDVHSVVVTHGTDTLEETAFFFGSGEFTSGRFQPNSCVPSGRAEKVHISFRKTSERLDRV